MKSAEESMEILEAFDLTRSLRGAAALAGCSHHTVARLVAERDAAGARPPRVTRTMVIAEFLPKIIEEWVEESHGNIRADVAHEKLTAMGFTGSPRTSRRAVAEGKANRLAGRRRVHRPAPPASIGRWGTPRCTNGPAKATSPVELQRACPRPGLIRR